MDPIFNSILTRRRRRAIDHLHEINSNDAEYVHVCEVDDYGEVKDSKKWKMPLGGELFFIGTDRATRLKRVEPTVFLCVEFFVYSGPYTTEQKTNWIDGESFDLSTHYIKKMTVTEKFVNAFHASDIIKSYGKKYLSNAQEFDLLTKRVISESFFINSFKNF